MTAWPPISVNLRWTLDQLLQIYLKDPALDGIALPAKREVPEGTVVNLSIELAPEKYFRVTGAVLRVRQDGQTFVIDIRFGQMQPELREWFEKQIASYKQRMQTVHQVQLKTGHELRTAVSSADLTAASIDTHSLDLAAGGGPILGIDLGTCNSAACYVEDGKAIMVELGDPGASETTLPSVIAFDDDGRATVGKKAQDGLVKNARRTVYGAKRFIGRTYDSPVVQSMLARFPYRVVRGNGGKVAIDINGQPVSLTAIAARILTTLKKRAELRKGVSFERAIITVPAYYNDNQRDAVMQAGRLAGFHVERILNEPTAAAIAYGLAHAEPRVILVYDLGGGTFDVSVMRVQNGELTVLATAGDTFLGGEDFDAVLLGYVANEFKKKTGKQLSQNHAALAIVKDACEKAKRRLTSKDKTTVSVREAVLQDRTTARLEVEVDRDTLEALVEPLVSRSLKICSSALRTARIDPAHLQDVLLVGGVTRMPYVKRRVAEHFEREPRSDLNPDEVVAMGAGMLAALPPQAGRLRDVLAMTIGIAERGRFKPLIPANTQVPCYKCIDLNVPLQQLATTSVSLYQGEAPELHQNELLGQVPLDSLKPGQRDPTPVRIELFLSADCLLKVRVCNLETQQAQQVLLSSRDD